MPSVSPGPWLRLTALGAAAGALVAVVSGTVGGDVHRAASALAVPPLVALIVAAWVAHRQLLPASVVALVLFGAAAAVTQPVLHVDPRLGRRLPPASSRSHRPSAASRRRPARGATTSR